MSPDAGGLGWKKTTKSNQQTQEKPLGHFPVASRLTNLLANRNDSQTTGRSINVIFLLFASRFCQNAIVSVHLLLPEWMAENYAIGGSRVRDWLFSLFPQFLVSVVPQVMTFRHSLILVQHEQIVWESGEMRIMRMNAWTGRRRMEDEAERVLFVCRWLMVMRAQMRPHNGTSYYHSLHSSSISYFDGDDTRCCLYALWVMQRWCSWWLGER